MDQLERQQGRTTWIYPSILFFFNIHLRWDQIRLQIAKELGFGCTVPHKNAGEKVHIPCGCSSPATDATKTREGTDEGLVTWRWRWRRRPPSCAKGRDRAWEVGSEDWGVGTEALFKIQNFSNTYNFMVHI